MILFTDASGPNWELYRPNSSRFYLPGAVSLAKYVSGEETIDERPLQQLVDFHRMVEQFNLNYCYCYDCAILSFFFFSL